jgi:hypothetical protein
MLAQSLSTSQKFAALHAEAGALAEFCQVLFVLAVAHADDCGRLQGDAWTVKQRVVPTSPRTLAEVDQALAALARVDLVQRYRADGRDVMAICRFQDHQEFRHPPRATLPPPPGTTDPPRPGTGADAPVPAGTGTNAPVPGLRKEVRKEVRKKDRARARAGLSALWTYLEDCTHDPPCAALHLCGQRRQLDAALRAGQVTPDEAARLERLWGVDPQMARAGPRRARKAEAS